MAISSIALTVGNWGQAELFLAEKRNSGKSSSVHVRVSLVAGSFTALAALGTLLVLGFQPVVACVAAVWIPMLIQGNIWRAAAIVRGNTLAPAMSNLVGAALRLLAIPTAALLGALDLFGSVLITNGSAALALLSTVGLMAFRHRRKVLRPRPSISRKQVVQSLTEGSHLIVFSTLTAITLNCGVLLTQGLSSPKQAGIYAAVFALAQSGLAISAAFKSRLQVVLYKPDPIKLVVRELTLLSAIGATGAIIAFIFADVICAVLLGPEFEGSAEVMRILAVAALGQMLLDSVHGMLVVVGKRRLLLLVAATGTVTALTVTLLLVQDLGAAGAAFAALGAFWAASIVGLVLTFSSLISDRRRL